MYKWEIRVTRHPDNETADFTVETEEDDFNLAQELAVEKAVGHPEAFDAPDKVSYYVAAIDCDEEACKVVEPNPQCELGLHSWVAEEGLLDPDTKCKFCGALYGYPD